MEGGAHAIHQMTLLQNFWQRQLQEIEHGDLDFKNFQLPLARIKKVMKTDEEVKMISSEAPMIFAKACEIFILELTLRSWIQTEEGKRRTLQRNDVASAISKNDTFDFLIDIVPREELPSSSASARKDDYSAFPAVSHPVLTDPAAAAAINYYYNATAAANAAAASMASQPMTEQQLMMMQQQLQQQQMQQYLLQQQQQQQQQPQLSQSSMLGQMHIQGLDPQQQQSYSSTFQPQDLSSPREATE